MLSTLRDRVFREDQERVGATGRRGGNRFTALPPANPQIACAEGHSVVIEEYARQMVYAEELHASEVDKMLRKPGNVAAFRPVEHLPGNRI
jgi:hypothetical protein